MPHPACNPAEHAVSRRPFLHAAGGAAAGGFGRLFAADHAARAASRQKHVILVFMSGGPSQFETWDPKTGRPTGGPHLSQPTTVPGVRFDEYMPNLSRLANRMATIRSMTSDLGDHMEGHYLAQTGHRPTAVVATAPHWLSVCAHERPPAGGVPGYVVLGAERGGNMAVPGPGFLGAGYQGLLCPGRGQGPADLPATGPRRSPPSAAGRTCGGAWPAGSPTAAPPRPSGGTTPPSPPSRGRCGTAVVSGAEFRFTP